MIKCVFSLVTASTGIQGSALVEKKISNDDTSNRKIAASNKTFTFGFKQNYETNRN